ncbi:DNA polymerase III subunit alpha [Selenomonas sp. TAMA-11512]|uniref:DNA polymerase III subunit alpha n=1 Tax=Selenomonas sp. TAMA-11512 TaxID=3095337 RepID=UPI00308EA844|nr:DNA polymerase III subunit alpha [Selenomonas sp. TAMA-11512]
MSANFAHLHVHTCFSLLDGASRIPELISRTKELGMDSIAITDHGAMYGVIDFYKEAKKQGVHPVIGCEVYLAPESRHDRIEIQGTRYYHLILLAETNEGYRNLSKLISLANMEGYYYKPRIDKELLRKYHQGLICLSACIAGEIPQMILRGNTERAEVLIEEYQEIFGKENFFLEIQNHGLPEEKEAFTGVVELAEKYNVKLVATNDIHYIHKSDSEAHDVLLAIQTAKTINDPTRMRYAEGEFYLRSPEEMQALFADYPEALTNTQEIAKRCQVEFTFGQLHLPNFPLPAGMTDTEYLKQLCEEKLPERYAERTAEIDKRLTYELSVIHQMGYDSYFLIVWDFINYAREQGIPVGPGRGSAAGSIVAYLLGITNLDPLAYDLLFERFLNPERITMPDIDIDFCYIRREEVIDYVKSRYGSDHVAQIITFGTMLAKGAIRDVGRALDMPYAAVDRVAKAIPAELGMTIDKAMKESQDFRQIYEENDENRELVDYARALEGLPRHASTHAAGVVIARDPLTEYLPVQVTDGTLVTEYDKDHVEELGLLKMDFLGLRTLTVMADAVKMIQKTHGIAIDIDRIPLEDKATAEMLTAGDTSAVFQMESAGMTNLVKDLRPERFSDLIPTVALYRPGPLGSGMVTDFIAGRHGKKVAEYLHPSLEPILKETFGVVLYQEQVMQVVQVLAGFSLGQADILRRAMGKKKHAVLMSQKETYLKGTDANHIDRALAEKIFDLLTHFADYGFNKSHSAAYALVAWQTAYLKAHYPAEFMAATLSSVKDTNDKVSAYIEQCKKMHLQVLPPDINASDAEFTAVDGAIRFGLAAVRNVGENAIRAISEARENGAPFTSLADLCSRVDARTVNKRVLESLIKCGAFDSLGDTRAALLSVLETVMTQAAQEQKDANSGQMGLFGEEDMKSTEIEMPNIAEVSINTLLEWEKETTGFYITGHPLDVYRTTIEHLVSLHDIADGIYEDEKIVRVGGLVSSAKRFTTKKGDTMCFLTLEDYTDTMEVVVFPKVFYENVNLLVPDTALVIDARVNHTDEGVKLLANTICALDAYKLGCYIIVHEDKEKQLYDGVLKNLRTAHPGEAQIYLQLKGRWRKLDEKATIDVSPAAVSAMEDVFGKGSIRLR